MEDSDISISGFIQEASPGRYIANANAVRKLGHFAVQKAKLTSVAFGSRAEAELQLQRLIDHLTSVLGPTGDVAG